MNRKKLFLIGALALGALVIFRGDPFDFSLDLTESQSIGSFGCDGGGNFTQDEINKIAFVYVDKSVPWVADLPVDLHAKPNTLIIWQDYVEQITPWSWMPFYKSGTSKMIRLYRVIGSEGTSFAGGETTFCIRYTAKGILSHHKYVQDVIDAERNKFEKDLRKKLTVGKQ